MAAITLELLTLYDPELLGAIRENRGSVDGQREVARRINAINPGLYKELRKIKFSSKNDVRFSEDEFVKAKETCRKVAGLLYAKDPGYQAVEDYKLW